MKANCSKVIEDIRRIRKYVDQTATIIDNALCKYENRSYPEKAAAFEAQLECTSKQLRLITELTQNIEELYANIQSINE